MGGSQVIFCHPLRAAGPKLLSIAASCINFQGLSEAPQLKAHPLALESAGAVVGVVQLGRLAASGILSGS